MDTKAWKDILESLAKQIEVDFGERCSEFQPLCCTCELWRKYDDLKEITSDTDFHYNKISN